MHSPQYSDPLYFYKRGMDRRSATSKTHLTFMHFLNTLPAIMNTVLRRPLLSLHPDLTLVYINPYLLLERRGHAAMKLSTCTIAPTLRQTRHEAHEGTSSYRLTLLEEVRVVIYQMAAVPSCLQSLLF